MEILELSDLSLKILGVILGEKVKTLRKGLEMKPVTQIANSILELNNSFSTNIHNIAGEKNEKR